LQNAVGESIMTYCVLDSDYHTPEEISERYQQAKDRNVQLHIWTQKEIENYLLSPEVVGRAIEQSLPKRTAAPTVREISVKLIEIGDALRDEVIDGLATEILARDRKLAASTANKRARERIDLVRAQSGNILSLISGKTAVSRLSEWSQKEFGVQINASKLARQMRQAEVPEEIRSVMAAIESQEPFEGLA